MPSLPRKFRMLDEHSGDPLIPTRHTELFFWLTAMVVLACTDPSTPPVIDLCVFKWAGVTCPGCGLGHGIAYLLDTNFLAAIDSHPLAPFALVTISGRIFRLLPQSTAAAHID
jgi:hypothetical protein